MWNIFLKPIDLGFACYRPVQENVLLAIKLVKGTTIKWWIKVVKVAIWVGIGIGLR